MRSERLLSELLIKYTDVPAILTASGTGMRHSEPSFALSEWDLSEKSVEFSDWATVSNYGARTTTVLLKRAIVRIVNTVNVKTLNDR